MKVGRTRAASRRRRAFRRGLSTVEVMVRDELRIVVAALATFAALIGVAVSIHGLLYYETDVVLSGVIAMAVSILACVLMLTLHPKDTEQAHQHRES
jgi:hypothetical protein